MMKFFRSLPILLFSFSAFSQTQGVAFTTVGKGVSTPFVTDYHSLGINVSALGMGTGYKDKRFTVGSAEFNFGIYSDELTSDKMKNLARTLYRQAVTKGGEGIDYERQKNAAAEYAEAGVGVNFDFNWAGFAFQNEKFGGIAFNIRENYQFYSKLNRTTTDILFRGKLSNYFDSLTVVFGNDTSVVANYENMSPDSLQAVIEGRINSPLLISQITNGSKIKMVWSRSYNIGYGRKIIGDSSFAIYGGIGARLIQSMAMFDMESDDAGLRVASSITPAFDIDYGNISGANILDYKGGIPPAVGNGYGLDFAASAVLFKKLKICAAINNIGSVTYTKNVYTVRDSLFGNFSLAGLDQSNITNSVNQLLRDGGIFELTGTEKFKVQNAADFRLGASFAPMERLRVGVDIVAPFDRDNPGSLQNAIVSVGGDFAPVKWLVLNAGYYGGGVYKSNIPLGITFVLKDGGYEFGVASRDALSFFSKNAHSVSVAFGFARFRF